MGITSISAINSNGYTEHQCKHGRDGDRPEEHRHPARKPKVVGRRRPAAVEHPPEIFRRGDATSEHFSEIIFGEYINRLKIELA